MRGNPVPDADHVLRHCSGTAIEWTEDREAIGVTTAALYDDDPTGISVTWVESFARSSDPELAAIEAICATRTVRPNHRFAKFRVGLIKSAGRDAGVELEVQHNPKERNEGHSVIMGLEPRNHSELIARLVLEIVALLSK